MATRCFFFYSEFQFSVLLMKNYDSSWSNFYSFKSLSCSFIYFDYFLSMFVIFRGFGKIVKKAKMADVWCNFFFIWRQQLVLRTPKETFWTYSLSSNFRCHSFNILVVKGKEESWIHPPPGPQKTEKRSAWMGWKENSKCLLMCKD